MLEQGAPGVLEERLVRSAETGRGTAGQDHRRPRHPASLGGQDAVGVAGWQAGAMQVVLVQEASSLDPVENRDRLE